MTNWPAVWVILAAGLAVGAHVGKVPPALPAVRADLGLTLLQSGFIHTMMYAIGAAIGVFGGAIADRFGQKRFALVGLGLMAAGSLLGALSSHYPVLLASRFCEGVGFILLTVSAAALLMEATQRNDRATAFALWSTYLPAGGTLAMLIAPFALATLGWRSLWLFLSLYTVLCAVLLARYVPAPKFGGGVASFRLLADSLTRPGVIALCVAFMCYVGQWTSLMTWLPTFTVDERGFGQGAASLLTAAFVAINIPGNLLGGLLLNRGMPRWAVLAGGAAVMGMAGLAIFSAGVPDGLRLASVLVFSLLGGVIPAAVFSATPLHAPSSQHLGTTNGMVMQASHISQFVVPILLAWLASRFGGWSASQNAMLALAFAGAAAAMAVGHFELRLRSGHEAQPG